MRPGEQPSTELIAGDRGARPLQPGDLAHAWAVLGNVMDPEVPVVSVVELGIVRDLGWQGGHLHVVVTPTYSGCPATEVIEQDIAAALEQAGFAAPQLERRLTPAWTTDWLSASGRERLRGYGIAPPEGSVSKRSLLGEAVQINCPQCGSAHTERLSEFGSTACKALYRCRDCLEPFDYFKCI
ncbi:phenylacetate-CoA oxygenase subunit PaaJ [Pseudomonas sp. 21LCFQ02]|uniref:1,2-phenylacetyl-CoA epoxidase subunit PaaD n=1 Tax=Pseudomonas sp. 21LCFQ02 TaxID=2957505 RepID=UPI00209AEC52|nr:1,2-phenylacetyl-CoA epoxidase subunit PaaD [Pseudomonas sp. 21LCFQ02]MCO8167413.1 phenylacetate-CoA oxygenase subunit PaaJ [Pseudomonas sp. 21LCFQ02]